MEGKRGHLVGLELAYNFVMFVYYGYIAQRVHLVVSRPRTPMSLIICSFIQGIQILWEREQFAKETHLSEAVYIIMVYSLLD